MSPGGTEIGSTPISVGSCVCLPWESHHHFGRSPLLNLHPPQPQALGARWLLALPFLILERGGKSVGL